MEIKQKINKIKELLEQDGPESTLRIADFLAEDELKPIVISAKFLEDEDHHILMTAIEALGESPINEKNKSLLLSLTKNQDELIRYCALEALWGYGGEDVFRAICSRLKDSNDLVRLTAVEALGNLRDIRGEENLIDALSDQNEIVRRNAAEGLGKLGDASAIPILQAFLQNETSSAAKVGFYVGLYLLGAEFRLKSLLNLLKDPSYQVRCSVANIVLDLVDEENKKLIIKALNAALRRETTVAASSTLQSALEELSSSNDSTMK